MSEPLLSREAIDRQAREAAQAWAGGASEPQCPYPHGSDAAAYWRERLQLWLLPFSQHAGEGIPC